MPDPIGPQAFLNLCEMSIDNKYELEALGELLQEKGIVRKGLDWASQHRRNPRGSNRKSDRPSAVRRSDRFFGCLCVESSHWPAFNVADSTISVGVVCLIIHFAFERKDAPLPAPDTPPRQAIALDPQ